MKTYCCCCNLLQLGFSAAEDEDLRGTIHVKGVGHHLAQTRAGARDYGDEPLDRKELGSIKFRHFVTGIEKLKL